MKNIIKTIIRDLIYIFLNYFVAYIPFWIIRKLFYMFFGMKIGKGSRICMKCVVMSPWKIEIGKDTMINEFVVLDGRGGLQIGSSCSISMGAVIYTASHYVDSAAFEYYSKKTEIKDCCWIGARAIILPDSIINDFSVIAANSLFKGETIRAGIYTGVPAVQTRIRKVTNNYKQKNMNFFK